MSFLFKIFIYTLVLITLFFFNGCASKSVAPIQAPESIPRPSSSPSFSFTEEDNDIAHSPAKGDEISSYDRKIVKTGYISLIVNNIVESISKITILANSLGGYVVSSNKQETERGINGQMSIRVPAEKYDETFEQIRLLAVKVPYENTESRDVTEEYTDLQARLKTMEATEEQYLILLSKAQAVEDILKVQRELTDIREKIEQTKGRIQYLERTSDMSLIQISLQETGSFQGNGWNALETIKSAVRGLTTFGKVLISIIIWLLIFCPLWIIIAVIVILIRRRRRKIKAHNQD